MNAGHCTIAGEHADWIVHPRRSKTRNRARLYTEREAAIYCTLAPLHTPHWKMSYCSVPSAVRLDGRAQTVKRRTQIPRITIKTQAMRPITKWTMETALRSLTMLVDVAVSGKPSAIRFKHSSTNAWLLAS